MPGLEWLVVVALLAEAIVIGLLVGLIRFCLVRWRKHVALPGVTLVLGIWQAWNETGDSDFHHHRCAVSRSVRRNLVL